MISSYKENKEKIVGIDKDLENEERKRNTNNDMCGEFIP